MPYYHCRKCQHEYEGYDKQSCDWCGADNPRILEEKTPLERMCSDPELITKMLNNMNKKGN